MLQEQELLQLHKIAILGGTFNPVHIGHIQMAKSVLETYVDIECLIVMPNHIPAYKEQTGIVSDQDRIAMLELAIENMDKVSVSDMEIARGGYTYTVETLRYIKGLQPDMDIYFVIGDDSLYSFHKWYEYREILSLCKLLVAVRHENHDTVRDYAETMMHQYEGAHIEVLPMEECEVSSSDIREKCKKGFDVSKYLSKHVFDYIQEHDLYS